MNIDRAPRWRGRIGLGQRERFVDAQPGAQQQNEPTLSQATIRKMHRIRAKSQRAR
jgi:hypothetical protein